MNFISCRLIESAGRLAVRIEGGPDLPVPAPKAGRYCAYLGKEAILGIRPEHCADSRPREPGTDTVSFRVRVDVVEPLGMDTMIHFRMGAQRISSLVDPYAVKGAGEEMELTMDLRKMHLIDPITDKVV